jgi:alkylhydroperoxidase family enzyme
MNQHLYYRASSPKGLAAVLDLESYVRSSGLEPPLLELIRTRASQINGCRDRAPVPNDHGFRGSA